MLANNKIIVQGTILENKNQSLMVLEKFEIGSRIIASTTVENNFFKFELPSTIEPGVYRLKYNPTEAEAFFDIIINGQEKLIEIDYNCEKPKSLPSFNPDSENYAYYKFLQTQTSKLNSLFVTQFFLQNYPEKKEKIYEKVLKIYHKNIKNTKKLTANFIKEYNHYFWAVALIKNKPNYIPNSVSLDNKQIAFEKQQNYWTNIDVSDKRLLNTPLFTDHILSYLQFYIISNEELSNKERETGLQQSVDKILTHFSVNEEAEKFAIHYLLKGFQEIGLHQIVTYIDQKYQKVIQKYSNQNQLETHQSRIESYEKLKPSTLAPNIEWKEANKEEKSGLHQIKAKEIVLVFWSSECSHCIESMNKLEIWALNNPDKVVVAIGIETDKEKYFESIKKYKNILFYTDFRGFDSIPVKQYAIQATPTFYLIDENKLIIKSYDYYPFK
jgi:thiol-disulfide isomerase/thioredoxin